MNTAQGSTDFNVSSIQTGDGSKIFQTRGKSVQLGEVCHSSREFAQTATNFKGSQESMLSAQLSLRHHRGSLYQSHQVADETREKQNRIQSKLRFGKNPESNAFFQQLSARDKTATTSFETQLKDYPKRFEISRSMNNNRVYPTNVIERQPRQRVQTHQMVKRLQKPLTVREM